MSAIQMADWKASKHQKRLVKQVLKSGRLTYGDKTRKLEKRFAELHDRKYALFTNSGTSALKIAIHALKDKYGWKDGDEVIIPAVTFVATMNVVLMNNLKPVLVDVHKSTVNMNPELIEKAITKRTVAILPVHLLGQPADMPAIMEIAQKHNLKVIEDSCETMFVSKYGHTAGSLGDVACFSSYVAHLMVTGVGGFITTNDRRLATIMRSMMFHGRDEAYLNIDDNNKTGKDFDKVVKRRFNFPRHGYSDRATELEAALGLGDLKSYRKMIRKRQTNAGYLLGQLIGYAGFPFKSTREHAFMFFPLYVENRDRLIEHLEKNGVHTRTMMPLTNQPVVKKYFGRNIEKDYPVAKWINKQGLLLPCHQYLKKSDLRYMVGLIKEFYDESSN